MRTHLRVLGILLVAALLALGGAACGDDDDGGGTGNGEATEPEGGSAAGGDASETEESLSPQAPTEIVGGETLLRLDPALADALDVAGIEVGPVGEAEATDGGILFPITEGQLDIDTPSGEVRHAGGLEFSAAGQSVEATELVIRPEDETVTADIAGERVPLLALDLGTPEVPQTGDVIVFPSEAQLGDGVVGALNDALGVGVFTGGLALGSLTTSAQRP